jgi:predicted site-specific integrase-resolvase
MNTVIYARYSSDSQREESIEGQIRKAQNLQRIDTEKSGKEIQYAYQLG